MSLGRGSDRDEAILWRRNEANLRSASPRIHATWSFSSRISGIIGRPLLSIRRRRRHDIGILRQVRSADPAAALGGLTASVRSLLSHSINLELHPRPRLRA